MKMFGILVTLLYCWTAVIAVNVYEQLSMEPNLSRVSHNISSQKTNACLYNSFSLSENFNLNFSFILLFISLQSQCHPLFYNERQFLFEIICIFRVFNIRLTISFRHLRDIQIFKSHVNIIRIETKPNVCPHCPPISC